MISVTKTPVRVAAVAAVTASVANDLLTTCAMQCACTECRPFVGLNAPTLVTVWSLSLTDHVRAAAQQRSPNEWGVGRARARWAAGLGGGGGRGGGGEGRKRGVERGRGREDVGTAFKVQHLWTQKGTQCNRRLTIVMMTRKCAHCAIMVGAFLFCPPEMQVRFCVLYCATEPFTEIVVVSQSGVHDTDPGSEDLPAEHVTHPHPPYMRVVASEYFPAGHLVQDGPLFAEHPHTPSIV